MADEPTHGKQANENDVRADDDDQRSDAENQRQRRLHFDLTQFAPVDVNGHGPYNSRGIFIVGHATGRRPHDAPPIVFDWRQFDRFEIVSAQRMIFGRMEGPALAE